LNLFFTFTSAVAKEVFVIKFWDSSQRTAVHSTPFLHLLCKITCLKEQKNLKEWRNHHVRKKMPASLIYIGETLEKPEIS